MPRILSGQAPPAALARGLGRLAAAGRRRWTDMPRDRRGPVAVLTGVCLLLLWLLPYGPVVAGVALLAAAARLGRERSEPDEEPGAGPEGPRPEERLAALYEALVPYFSSPDDPHPRYVHEGDWEQVLSDGEFDHAGRLTRLRIAYPPYFRDGEAEARAHIEQLLYAKCGREREYHFAWHEDENHLDLSVLEPLPTDVRVQRFVTSRGEAVLGLTDAASVRRTLPVHGAGGLRDAPPVVWRTGPRSTEPHLLALGQPGTGTTTLLRSLALQALPHGDVLVVDGGGGGFGFLAGRAGVLAVESSVGGTLALLRWVAQETERRLAAAGGRAAGGGPAPAVASPRSVSVTVPAQAAGRPLWVIVDRPATLTHLARAGGRQDPQELLAVPLRHGRAANVTVVVADQFDCAASLGDAVREHAPARVVLGPASPRQLEAVLGAPPHTTPVRDVPPGRGYARLGTGPVHRLQVPWAPDPYHRETPEAVRRAVLELLPERAKGPAPAADTPTGP